MDDKPFKVLLVNGPCGRALEELLARDGESFDVKPVGGLQDAAREATAEDFDVVVLDGLPPGELGHLPAGVPAVLLVGVAAEQAARGDAFFLVVQGEPGGGPPESLARAVAAAGRFRRAAARLSVFARALDAVAESVCMVDLDGRIRYVNRAFQETYGWGKDEIAGSHGSILWEDEADFLELKEKVRRSFEGTWEGEFYHLTRDGRRIPVSLTLSMLRDERGRDTGVVAAMRQSSEDGRLEEALNRLSCIDPLTGLPDRRAFEDALGHEWRRARRQGDHLAVVLADLDAFRLYNEACGPRAGDACLKSVAAAIGTALRRPGDLAARTGGGVFALLLPGTDTAKAAAFAERLRAGIEALGIAHPSSPTGDVLTARLGVAAAVPAADAGAGELVALAERALAEAKREGGNRIRAFSLQSGGPAGPRSGP